MRILIIHDEWGENPSLDEIDTMEQVKLISKSLNTKGHEVLILPFSLNLIKMKESIISLSPHLIFNLVETLHGSTLLHIPPSLFESLHVPFTGAPSLSMMISSNKILAKEEMLKANLPTPRWIAHNHNTDINEFIGLPIIIKPISEEASVGINDESVRTFYSTEYLDELLSSKTHFLEEYINGREFNVSILNIEGTAVVLPPAQMLFIDYPIDKPNIVGYEAKWEESSFAYHHTTRTFTYTEKDEPLIEQLKELTLKAFILFGSKGYMRVDFRVDSLQKPYILEVNMNPCLNKDSGFVAAAKEAGIEYDELIELIIKG